MSGLSIGMRDLCNGNGVEMRKTPCSAVQYSTGQYSTVQYSCRCSAVQYTSVQYRSGQFNTISKCSAGQSSTISVYSFLT